MISDVAEDKVQWENEKLAKVKIRVLRGHSGGVNSCCYLDRDTLVASAGDDKTIRIWDSEQRNEKQIMTGHKAEITCCRSGPSGRQLASAALDKYLILWDVETGQRLVESCHEGMVMTCDISYDGKYLLSCTDLDNAVVLWDIRQRTLIKCMKYHKSTVMSCRFSRSSYRFCTTSIDMTSCVVDMMDYRDKMNPNVVLRMGDHSNVISSCDFSLDERRLCTGSWDKTINVWDINTGSYRSQGPVCLQSGLDVGGHEGSLSACRFTKDGSSILSASYDESLIMWDVEHACQKFAMTGHVGWVTDCDFSEDETCVISSSKDGTVRCWNIENGDQIPVVMQNKKNIGLRLLECKGCKKHYSITQAQDAGSVMFCVFCRLEKQSLV